MSTVEEIRRAMECARDLSAGDQNSDEGLRAQYLRLKLEAMTGRRWDGIDPAKPDEALFWAVINDNGDTVPCCVPGDTGSPSPAVALIVTPEQCDRMEQAVLEQLIADQSMPREERCSGKYATKLVNAMLGAA